MKIIALLQARNEGRFVTGWLENVAPAVDGIVALDDGSEDSTGDILSAHPKTLELLRNPVGKQWNEYANQVSLIKFGRRLGADWFLCLDADERIEERLAKDLPRILLEAEDRKLDAFSLQLRDLWNDRFHYRIDGAWANRSRYRLFRNVVSHTRFDPRRLHRSWMPLEIVTNLGNAGANLPYAFYHLRMIKLEDRIKRYRRYRDIDPHNRYQPQGYEHLINEDGIELASVEPDRDFLPRSDPALE